MTQKGRPKKKRRKVSPRSMNDRGKSADARRGRGEGTLFNEKNRGSRREGRQASYSKVLRIEYTHVDRSIAWMSHVSRERV